MIKTIKERDAFVASMVAAGYTKDYVLEQEQMGIDAFNQGIGSGHLSDMGCEFYLMASCQ